MAKETIQFESFVDSVGSEHEQFVIELNDYLCEQGCVPEIKEAKSGYVVSYIYKPQKRTIANYVFRKKGPMLRIYADNVVGYLDILESLPESMKKTLKKAPACKRMINPDSCNSRCVMGFDYILEGERQEKCRYSGFLFYLDDETKPYLRQIMEREMQERLSQ